MLLQINPDHPSRQKMDKVIESLKSGGLVIFPTDTIYTIGCDLYNYKALERLADLKDNKTTRSHFSVICADIGDISEYTLPFSNSVYRMMNRTLPGPYTYILNANKQVGRLFDFNKKTIGMRVPNNNIARELARELGNPLIASSVHDEDEIRKYMTDPREIHDRFGKQVDIVIDGGVGDNTASTIIDATKEEPEVMREGKGALEEMA